MRRFFNKLREGLAAGNKDLKVLGDQQKNKDGSLNDIPKFTPFNCNFFKQTVSATEQADKMLHKSANKDEPRLTSDKINPVYDRARYKQYINKATDQKFMAKYRTEATKSLLRDMHRDSDGLLYAGEKRKSEKAFLAEEEAILREILLK